MVLEEQVIQVLETDILIFKDRYKVKEDHFYKNLQILQQLDGLSHFLNIDVHSHF